MTKKYYPEKRTGEDTPGTAASAIPEQLTAGGSPSLHSDAPKERNKQAGAGIKIVPNVIVFSDPPTAA